MPSVMDELDTLRGHIALARTTLWRLRSRVASVRTPASVRFMLSAVEETLATAHRLLDLTIGLVPAMLADLSAEVLDGKEPNRSDTGGANQAGPARPGDDVPPGSAG